MAVAAGPLGNRGVLRVGGVGALFAAAFALDLWLPAGITAGVSFIVPVLLSYWLPWRSAPLWCAGLGSALTLLGYALAPASAAPQSYVLANVALSVVVICGTGAVLVLVRKIADRRRDQDRSEFRLAELNHRVKNILATVDAMVRLSLAGSGTPESVRTRVSARIAAMAHMHARLVDDDWRGLSLAKILEEELAPYRQAAEENVRFEGEDVVLPPKSALALDLVVHELATNAAKYGALSGPEGRLWVGWHMRDDEAGSRLRISWMERSPGPVSEPTHAGFGRKVIESCLSAEVGGEARLIFAPEGVQCHIELPLVESGRSPESARAA